MDTINYDDSKPSVAIVNSTIEALYERLHPGSSSKTADLKNELHLGNKKPEETEFYIERIFLEHYFTKPYLQVGERYESEFYDETSGERLPCRTIEVSSSDTIDGVSAEVLRLNYYSEQQNIAKPGRLALNITDQDDYVLYWRSEEHKDLKTEWYINCYAQDLTDENGNLIFNGEPVNL